MRVYEAAREFKVEPDKMLGILRGMGARVTSEASQVDDATVAKLRARLERERRAGHTDLEESLEAVVEDAQPAGRRRRRKKEDLPEPVVEEPIVAAAEADSTVDAVADAAEAIAAEAVAKAAAQGENVAEPIEQAAARPRIAVVPAEAQAEPEQEAAPAPEPVEAVAAEAEE
ncbi:MAG: hypothetical protein ACRELT_07055, partial [Longimicrobiales bacterium]